MLTTTYYFLLAARYSSVLKLPQAPQSLPQAPPSLTNHFVLEKLPVFLLRLPKKQLFFSRGALESQKRYSVQKSFLTMMGLCGLWIFELLDVSWGFLGASLATSGSQLGDLGSLILHAFRSLPFR